MSKGRLQKLATGRNAPQGVENVHTLCEGKPEPDDRGNNMYYAKKQGIGHIINVSFYYYYYLTFLGPFHKAFFQWHMTKISYKSADNQSEARISVAYNRNCHLSLMTSFVKSSPCQLFDFDLSLVL